MAETVQDHCKRLKISIDKIDLLHSKCTDHSKSPSCQKSGNIIYSCNTQHLQKAHATKRQSYSEFSCACDLFTVPAF